MRAPRRVKLLGAFVALLGAALLFAPLLLRAAGRFLVVADPLEVSDAIVVMSGEIPFRQIEAARLFNRGLAPQVVLTCENESTKHRKLREIGLEPPDRRELARMVLERLSVPHGSIRLLRDPARDTVDELAAVHRFASQEGLRRIIIVSSPDHMRRIRLVWRRRVASEVEARLHPAPEEDGFDPDRWWTSRVGAEYFVHEYFGMLNFLLGSPLRRKLTPPHSCKG